MNFEQYSHICTLTAPAKCEHQVDGRLAFIALCGGNSLNDEVKACPVRVYVYIQKATDGRSEA